MEEVKDPELVIAPEEQGWTNIMFDSMILGTFMSCPREMKFKFVDHLVPISGPSKNFGKGLLMHKGLQTYYAGMQKGDNFTINKPAAIQAMRLYSPTLGMDSEDILLVYKTFEQYLEYRKNDIFQVLFTEKLFRFIVYEVFPLRIILTGRIDLGILENGGTIPIDHKTESEHWFYSALSNQFKIYALACQSQRLVVNRIGFQETVKPEKKFKREDINFDKDVLDEFKNEVLPYYAKQMLIAMDDNYFPPNYTSCIKGHWGCIFSDRYSGGICNITRRLRSEKIKQFFIEKEWNPADEAHD